MFELPLLSSTGPVFLAGLGLSLSLFMSIGPQNAHVLRIGLQRRHLALTVAVCVLADAALIALGVLGLSAIGGMSIRLQGAMVGAGVVFLLMYGWQAFERCRLPKPMVPMTAMPVPGSAGRAVMAALAFSWLNPHAWLDTAVLIGTASLAYGTPGNAVFAAGAATGSLVWFVVLGAVAMWLGRRVQTQGFWRALDGVVALMMWATAGFLILRTLQS